MSGRVASVSLRRNILYGLAGWGVPAAVVLASYSVLIRHLGAARFGIFVLAASMSGLLAFLDFGFAAATLKFVAEDDAAGNRRAAAEVIVSSLMFYGLLGIGCAAALQLFAPWIAKTLGVDARSLRRRRSRPFVWPDCSFPRFFSSRFLSRSSRACSNSPRRRLCWGRYRCLPTAVPPLPRAWLERDCES